MTTTIRVIVRKHTKLGGTGDWRNCDRYCKFRKICFAFEISRVFERICPSVLRRYATSFMILGVRRNGYN